MDGVILLEKELLYTIAFAITSAFVGLLIYIYKTNNKVNSKQHESAAKEIDNLKEEMVTLKSEMKDLIEKVNEIVTNYIDRFGGIHKKMNENKEEVLGKISENHTTMLEKVMSLIDRK